MGPGREFADIASAWNSLNGKILPTDVLIKVDDGQYTATGIALGNQPFANRIRIRGNVSTRPPARSVSWPAPIKQPRRGIHPCSRRRVLRLPPDRRSHRKQLDPPLPVSWRRLPGMERGELLDTGGRFCRVVSGPWLAFQLQQAQNQQGQGMGGGGQQRLPLRAELFERGGRWQEYQIKVPLRLDANERIAKPAGVLSQDTSRVWAAEGRVSGAQYGFLSTRNAYIWCDGSVVEQSVIGYEASAGGVIWNHGSNPVATLPQGRRGKALNCDVGFQATGPACSTRRWPPRKAAITASDPCMAPPWWSTAAGPRIARLALTRINPAIWKPMIPRPIPRVVRSRICRRAMACRVTTTAWSALAKQPFRLVSLLLARL